MFDSHLNQETAVSNLTTQQKTVDDLSTEEQESIITYSKDISEEIKPLLPSAIDVSTACVTAPGSEEVLIDVVFTSHGHIIDRYQLHPLFEERNQQEESEDGNNPNKVAHTLVAQIVQKLMQEGTSQESPPAM